MGRRLGPVCCAALMLAGLLSAQPPAAAQDVIRIAEHRSVRLDALRTLLPAIERELGIDVRVVEYPSPALDYFTKLVTELRSGNAPDVFTVPRDQQIDDLAAAGYLADLSRELETWDGYEHLVPLAKNLAQATFDRRSYVVPSILAVERLYYRKDILEARGISTAQPADWQELLERGRAIRERTGQFALLFPAGLTWGTGAYTEGFRHLLAGSSDPRLLTDDGRYRLSSAGVRDALEFYQTLIEEGLTPIRPLLNPEPWIIPKYEMFPAGELLVTTCGTWCMIFDWGPNSRNPIPDLEQRVAAWDVPGKHGGRHVMAALVYGWAVNQKSRRRELAKRVALALGSVDAAIAYAQGLGNVPARLDAAQHEGFAALTHIHDAHAQLLRATAVQTTVGSSTLMAGVARATESLLTGREDAEGAQRLLLEYVRNILGDEAVAGPHE
ncbi:MAG: extracellular solute-binding protein [Proteobacteria bacterium]|nr:extracellular solute-binding protein [Pseudomonadota bacterium]